MNLRFVSWQQALVMLACLGALVGSHYLGGPTAVMLTGAATTILAWCMRGPNPPNDPPAPPPGDPPAPGAATLRVLVGGASALALCLTLSACDVFNSPSDRGQMEDHAGKLLKCQEAGRAAPDGGHIRAYDDCKSKEGL